MAVWSGVYGDETIRYEGCVLNTYERNGYDDSDWYAECWDREKQKIVTVLYDTTRAGGGGWAKIDVTDDVLREVYRYKYNEARGLFDGKINEIIAKDFGIGDEVIVVRGRKVPKGTVGKVFWRGKRYNYYSRENEDRVGIEVNGNRVFLLSEYVIRKDWENHLLHGKERKQMIRNRVINSMPYPYRNAFDPAWRSWNEKKGKAA